MFITDKDGSPITVNGIPVDAYDVGILFNETVGGSRTLVFRATI